jgi:hypothetical protein
MVCTLSELNPVSANRVLGRCSRPNAGPGAGRIKVLSGTDGGTRIRVTGLVLPPWLKHPPA